MKTSRGMKSEMKKETLREAEENVKQLGTALDDLSNKILQKGMIPKDALGLSDAVVEGIYAQAYRLYNTGKYVEASHLFRMLIMLNVSEAKYLLGLAACFHMLKEYQNAVQTYTMCAMLDPENPIPHYHASDCYVQMKDPLSAIIALDLAVKRAGEKPEYAKIKERALLSIESLKTQLMQKGTGMGEDESSDQ